MWWLVSRSPTVAITYPTSRDLSHTSHRLSILFLPSKAPPFPEQQCWTLDPPFTLCRSLSCPKKLENIIHSDIYVKEINSSIPAVGELNCDIIGNQNSPVFKEINELVTAQASPILIGQNILGHDTLDFYLINNRKATAEFRRTLTSGYTVHTASITPASTSTYDPAYGARITISHNQPTIKLQPNIQTLNQELTSPKRNKSLLPLNH